MKASEQEAMRQLAADTARLKILQKAKWNNDITLLLRPWYSYRLYVKFLEPYYDRQTGYKKDVMHFYGKEELCSYNQCLHGHFPQIELDKLKGYKACIEMAEKTFVGKYVYATLYARDVFPDGKFTTICRYYTKNGLKDVNDPVIEPSANQIIYHYKRFGDYLDVTNVPQEDFAALISESLNL